jgi:YcaO-like protein with predicted kinase domain
VNQAGEPIGEAYVIDGGGAIARKTVAGFTQTLSHRLGVCQDQTDHVQGDLIEQIVKDWFRLGGDARECLKNRAVCGAARPASDSELECPAGREHVPLLRWDQIRKDLQSIGITLGVRPSAKVRRSPFLRPIGLISVFECTDQNGKVVSEGKGRSRALAYKSALGEAVERVAAQRVFPERIVTASPHHLRKSGEHFPEFDAHCEDLYSDDLIMDWVPAQGLDGTSGLLPAELVYYPYDPILPVRAFSAQHTAGLASAGSVDEAAAKGLSELLETDAYWTSMRLQKICCRVDGLATRADLVGRLTRKLDSQGINVHAGLISFHWPIPIFHVVCEARGERIPALSHGLGASIDSSSALEHALLEAIQVYSGLQEVAAEYWPQICLSPSATANPALVWSTPAHKHRVIPMFERAPSIDLDALRLDASINSFQNLEDWLRKCGYRIWIAKLGSLLGLETVRVFSEDLISPFSERSSPSQLLMQRSQQYNGGILHFDPILT